MDGFKATIIDGGFDFGTPIRKARIKEWTRQHVGKEVTIKLDESISRELRAFFEGGICPMFALQHIIVAERRVMTPKEAREYLKWQYNPIMVTKPDGTRERTGGSTAKLSKKGFRTFIDKILHDMEENGQETPDPEDYKRWRDSGPLLGEEYPPLQRLKEKAQEKLDPL